MRLAERTLSATGPSACRERNSPPAMARIRKTTAPPATRRSNGRVSPPSPQGNPQVQRKDLARTGREDAELSPTPGEPTVRGPRSASPGRRPAVPVGLGRDDARPGSGPPRSAPRLHTPDLAADLCFEFRGIPGPSSLTPPAVPPPSARGTRRSGLPAPGRARDGPTRIRPRGRLPARGSSRGSIASVGPPTLAEDISHPPQRLDERPVEAPVTLFLSRLMCTSTTFVSPSKS